MVKETLNFILNFFVKGFVKPLQNENVSQHFFNNIRPIFKTNSKPLASFSLNTKL